MRYESNYIHTASSTAGDHYSKNSKSRHHLLRSSSLTSDAVRDHNRSGGSRYKDAYHRMMMSVSAAAAAAANHIPLKKGQGGGLRSAGGGASCLRFSLA